MKRQAVCNLSVVPLRAAASHRSEQVSQLIFGEYFTILEEQVDWVFVKVSDPVYEGWLQRGQYGMLEEGSNDFSIIDVGDALLKVGDASAVPLLHGAVVPSEDALIINGQLCQLEEAVLRKPKSSDLLSELPRLIDYYLGAPYLWGGRSRFGIDCSGLSQLVYRHFAISLARDASQQALQGDTVDFLQEACVGDLAFFDNEEGHITHVGILLDSERIFHASARVRIDAIDTTGIFDAETKTYTHRLRIIKRLFTDELLETIQPTR